MVLALFRSTAGGGTLSQEKSMLDIDRQMAVIKRGVAELIDEKELRKKLDDIGAGNASIGASMDERSSSAIIISEPTKAVSHGGKLSI